MVSLVGDAFHACLLQDSKAALQLPQSKKHHNIPTHQSTTPPTQPTSQSSPPTPSKPPTAHTRDSASAQLPKAVSLIASLLTRCKHVRENRTLHTYPWSEKITAYAPTCQILRRVSRTCPSDNSHMPNAHSPRLTHGHTETHVRVSYETKHTRVSNHD